MTISPSINIPSENANDFDNKANNYVKWISQTCNEATMAFRNYGLLSAGSNSIISLSVGPKSIVINANSAFVPGMYVRISSTKNIDNYWMSGFVTAYTAGTLTLDVDVDHVSGDIQDDSWVIFPSSFVLTKNKIQSEIYVHSGNGLGTTNTAIARFLTIAINKGTDITYSDSAANGALFTTNQNGLYMMSFGHNSSASATTYGISINSTQLSTSILSINTSDILCRMNGTSNSLGVTVNSIKYLNVGDLVRPHCSLSMNSTDGVVSYFRITRVI